MIKSPLNYIGGKYKLLPQMLPFFPQQINTFVDLFAGGLNVALNVQANHIICNDINNYLIDLYRYFQSLSIEKLIDNINKVIDTYKLSKQNTQGYNDLRDTYNQTHDSLYLFLLICYGFNHQIRYNSKGEFNTSFGKDRSSYNSSIEQHLRSMHEAIKNFDFQSENFRNLDLNFMQPGDFLYADPPYLISCAAYNDGKRGFEGWSAADDKLLFTKLDELNERGIKFALSNVIVHKNQVNQPLMEWSEKYQIHHLNIDYGNSNYQATENETDEVLITNY